MGGKGCQLSFQKVDQHYATLELSNSSFSGIFLIISVMDWLAFTCWCVAFLCIACDLQPCLFKSTQSCCSKHRPVPFCVPVARVGFWKILWSKPTLLAVYSTHILAIYDSQIMWLCPQTNPPSSASPNKESMIITKPGNNIYILTMNPNIDRFTSRAQVVGDNTNEYPFSIHWYIHPLQHRSNIRQTTGVGNGDWVIAIANK